jgi:Nif-specific regulatory protein
MDHSQQNAPAAYLVIRQEGSWSDIFRLLPNQVLTIGRSSKCAIVVPDDRTSRRHAEVYFDQGSWMVRDLDSRNGTLLNEAPVHGAVGLKNGQVIQVASCRMSFADSLVGAFGEPGAGPLSDEGASEQATQEIDLPTVITHRTELEAWSTKLAFEIASQASWGEACETALGLILQTVGAQAGGILGIESFVESRLKSENKPSDLSNQRLTVLAARERSGKAYHRIGTFLWKNLASDRKSILARNVQNDPQMGDVQSSQTRVTSSVLCSPILNGDSLLGLVHVYTRDDEPMLTPKSLEVASAAAQMLGAAYQQFSRQRKIQRKLSASLKEVERLKEQLTDHQRDFEMIGDSPAMKRMQSQLERVAATQATVLLRGESGSGKELAAREIHRLSQRSSRAFIAINCGALTPSLLESELFGHEKGSFTGATERKLGKFELADGGTLMLDEVGEMSPEIQVKFLRILEGQPFERVGGSKPISVDVRVISATNRDLEDAVQQGRFRSDLYFRLRVVEIAVPSLRDRSEDVLLLANHFLSSFRLRSGHGPVAFSREAESAILTYSWPGNIRELRNSVERAHVLASGELAELDDLALSNLKVPGLKVSVEQPATVGYRERSLDEVEREHILATLERTEGQKSRAAAILGIERSTLDRKLKRFEEEASNR